MREYLVQYGDDQAVIGVDELGTDVRGQIEIYVCLTATQAAILAVVVLSMALTLAIVASQGLLWLLGL
jgi:hypothetical protein